MNTRAGAWAVVAAAAILGWGSASAEGALFDQVVVFGDSLSDIGNDFIGSELLLGPGNGIPAAPYFAGRFSNGPVWVEYVNGKLGLPALTPGLAGGTNWAFGGAQSGFGLSPLVAPNVGGQLELYGLTNPTISDRQLFVMWAGPNDFWNGQTDPSVPVENLGSHLRSIIAAGGEHFLVPNLPPLGETPDHRNNAAERDALNLLSVAFNVLLEQELQEIEAESPGVTITRVDVLSLYVAVAANPGAVGLTNITDPAFDDVANTVVPNPNEYLYWDGIHPTAVSHKLLGLYAYAALCDQYGRQIPEPATLGVLAVGAVGLLRRRR